jgi:hypothetical protein
MTLQPSYMTAAFTTATFPASPLNWSLSWMPTDDERG